MPLLGIAGVEVAVKSSDFRRLVVCSPRFRYASVGGVFSKRCVDLRGVACATWMKFLSVEICKELPPHSGETLSN